MCRRNIATFNTPYKCNRQQGTICMLWRFIAWYIQNSVRQPFWDSGTVRQQTSDMSLVGAQRILTVTQIKHPTRCNNQLQNLLLCPPDTAQHVLGITMPIIRSPSNCRCSLWFPHECGGGNFLSRGQLRTLPPPHSYGNQKLQRQFDGLLMMGIVMPETFWAVSGRQSNKFYDWLLHLVGCFIWVIEDARNHKP